MLGFAIALPSLLTLDEDSNDHQNFIRRHDQRLTLTYEFDPASERDGIAVLKQPTGSSTMTLKSAPSKYAKIIPIAKSIIDSKKTPMTDTIQPNIIIYKTDDSKANVALYAQDGDIWLNQNQLAELFAISKKNICQHIAKILKKKLLENSVVKNFFTTAKNNKIKTHNREHHETLPHSKNRLCLARNLYVARHQWFLWRGAG